MENELSAIEKDILKEMFSFGLAKSADSLSVISKESVYLNIPAMEILDIVNIISFIKEIDATSSMIRSNITGDIVGETFLIFTEEQGDRLARICIGSSKNFEGNYLALQRSLLLELGNILTGSLVTQIANILAVHIYGSPPELITGAKRVKLGKEFEEFFETKPIVVTVMTEFVNSESVIELPFIIVFDLETVEKILHIIRQKSKSGEGLFTK
jgi:chemotaxis protein CheC